VDNSTLTLSSQAKIMPHTSGQTYLKFHVGQKIPMIVPMHYVREAINLTLKRLSPMPSMPEYVLGLMYRHGRAIWAIDIARFLDIGAIGSPTYDHDFVVLQVGATSFAIAVQQLQGAIWLAADEVQHSLGYTNSTAANYLSGCALKEQEVLLVLDAEAIVQSSSFQPR
jgi:positive phototaxis protein PixI